MSATVTLVPWGGSDLPLLQRLMGDPRMTEHLGGPESPDKLRDRQKRYERLDGGDRMFKIVDDSSGAGAGSVGFWTTEWRDEQVYEVGWMVVPECQGRGIAVAAAAWRSSSPSVTTRTASCTRSRTSTTPRRTRSAADSASSCSERASSSSRSGTS